MRLAVVGANGRTGAEVVRQALDRGHDVSALVRRPETVPETSTRLSVQRVDVREPDSVAVALSGCDAVLSAVGAGADRSPTTVYSDGARALLAGAAAQGIRRVSVLSAAPAGPPRDQAPFIRWVVGPILERFFGSSYADMRRMEQVLAASDMDWVCLRPSRLVRRPAAGYRTSPHRPPAGSLGYADLAAALLDSLDEPTWRRVPQYVAR